MKYSLPLLSNTSQEYQKLEPIQSQQASIPHSTDKEKKKGIFFFMAL